MKYFILWLVMATFAWLLMAGCSSNKPPTVERPNGPSVVIPNIPDTFSVIANDPDGDNVRYQFDWGNNVPSDWSELLSTGTIYKTTYAYSARNYYNIKCRAKDQKGKTSDWSDPLLVTCGLGFIRWSFTCPDEEDFNSTPAIDNQGNIYAGCVAGHLHSLNANGQERSGWPFNSIGGDEFISSPAIAPNGTIYACDRGGYIYALNPNGNLIWSYLTDDEILATPAIGRNNEVYVASTDGYLYAFTAQGDTMWRREISTNSISSIAIDSWNYLYFGDDAGYFYSYDTAGNRRWRYYIGTEVYSSPAVMPNGRICVGGRNGYHYIFNSDSTLFRRELVGDISSSPVIGTDGAIYVTTEAGRLCRISADGVLEWEFSTNDGVCSSPAVVKYENIAGDLICFKASWGKKKQNDVDSLYIVKADGTPLSASPLPQALVNEVIISSPMVAPNGTIYIGGGLDYELDPPKGGLFALTGIGAAANSSWPLFRRDTKNSGRVQ